jgi:hypothetical protein
METIQLQTESYLFENSEGYFRAIPFYELSIDEWVVYEKGHPKYLIDFNRRTKPLITDLKNKLNSGEQLEETVQNIGRFIGRQWTTKHNIQGNKVSNSHQDESISLLLLDNLGDLFMDVIFVATDDVNLETLLDEDKLIKAFVTDVDDLGLESGYAENQEDLIYMLALIFGRPLDLMEVTSNHDKNVYDLTKYKHDCIAIDELETNYENWLSISKRETSMTQYGILISIISYIRNHIDKKHLLIIVEKRKHWR